jgi:hypothetical protein
MNNILGSFCVLDATRVLSRDSATPRFIISSTPCPSPTSPLLSSKMVNQSAAAPERQDEVCRRRRHERVQKLYAKKLRAKTHRHDSGWDDSSSHSRMASWSPRNSSLTGAAAARRDWFLPTTSSTSSDSENGDAVTIPTKLTRAVRNRVSAKASRDKKNNEIEALSKKVERLESENKDLISFLSRLPQSVLNQLQDSDQCHHLLSLKFA